MIKGKGNHFWFILESLRGGEGGVQKSCEWRQKTVEKILRLRIELFTLRMGLNVFSEVLLDTI